MNLPGAQPRPLRAGEWVEVRSKEEILRTLDKNGALGGMPFMPEMFRYCGQKLRVFKTAHKTCDTISGDWMGRRLEDSLHLEDVRCDGGSHGGCEAACLLYWKEAWVKRSDGPDAPVPAAPGCSEADVVAATRTRPGAAEGRAPDGYACQATEVLRATTPLPWWDVRQYVEDYRSGNVTLRKMAEGALYSGLSNLISFARYRPRVQNAMITLYDRVQGLRGGVPFPRKFGKIPAGQKTPSVTLNLQPGELVRVKSYDEILETLDESNQNRGMSFDAEQVLYCGGTYRVRARVNKIVNEKDGRLLQLKTPSVLLEGATCQACYSNRRMFCPRAVYPYWRETWLERV
jgi:hypothetical protein